MKLTIMDNGDYTFSGRAVNVTAEKNKACAAYGKQVLNYGCVFEALPDERQKTFFAKSFGCKRVVENHYLKTRQSVYASERRTLTSAEYKKTYLPALKKEKPYLREPDKFVYDSALIDADTAYKNFFEGRAGFPKFVSKNKPNGNSYTTHYTNGNISIFKGKDGLPYIKLPKTVAVRFILPKGTSIGDFTKPGLHILRATVKKTGGRYTVSVGFETLIDKIEPVKDIPVRDVIGIDVGLKDFCHYGTRDNKISVPNPRWIKLHAKRLRRLQQSLSRKRYDRKTHKGSKNYYKALEKVRREQKKTADQRRDFHHKLSRKIADSCSVAVCEDLNIKGMMKNRHLSKAIASVGWGQFVTYLSYKLERKGWLLIKVGRFFPSSQNCHVCGYKNTDVKDLSVRKWKCPVCGTFHDRDDNAVDNMILEGIRIFLEERAAIQKTAKTT